MARKKKRGPKPGVKRGPYKKRKTTTVAPAANVQIEKLAAEFALNPRKHRFYLALARALPIMTNDELDRIEPTLAAAIGRHAIAEDERLTANA